MHTSRVIRSTLAALGTVLLAAACSGGSTTASDSTSGATGPAAITLFGWPTALGTVVGSDFGVVAYADAAEHGSTVACTAACTTTWEPWVTRGKPLRAGAGVDKKLIGTIKRPDGSTQLTYGGHALYLYAHTKGSMQTNAQGAGGVWFVVGANGGIVK
jgi:predicted lipoprotein with Yx(FWY)xxD motif